MTRDEIIRMAWEAGFKVLLPQDHGDGTGGVYVVEDEIAGMLEHFANLVAAAERDECAKLCESLIASEYATGKVDHNERGWTELCASKIRARGEKP